MVSGCPDWHVPLCEGMPRRVRHVPRDLAASGGSSPFCFALAGAEQTKLVCELVEECLEPDCVRLVLR